MTQLAGKRALVTGGSRGIGAAIARTLAEAGADVAITYVRSEVRAAAVVADIKAHGRNALSVQADSGDPEAIRRAVSETVEGLGGLDILINNAAAIHGGPIADIALSDLQEMLDANIRGPVLFAQAVIPHLTQGGRIISIGSAFAERVPVPGVAAYALTKSALLAFTRGLSRELGPRGVTVNLVLPGSTDTEMNPAEGESADHQRAQTSLGRFGKPQEIADAVTFLAGPAASFMTGSVMTVDGGANA